MKKTILSLACIVIFVGCSSPDKNAKKLIEEELRTTLHDWSSYESVKYGTLDSAFTTLFDNPEFVTIASKTVTYNKLLTEAMDDYKGYEDMTSNWAISKRRALLNKAKSYLDSANYYTPMYEKMDSLFIPEFKGWKMQHSYRANNAAGNKGIAHYMYYFNKEITKVLDVEDISKSSNK